MGVRQRETQQGDLIGILSLLKFMKAIFKFSPLLLLLHAVLLFFLPSYDFCFFFSFFFFPSHFLICVCSSSPPSYWDRGTRFASSMAQQAYNRFSPSPMTQAAINEVGRRAQRGSELVRSAQPINVLQRQFPQGRQQLGSAAQAAAQYAGNRPSVRAARGAHEMTSNAVRSIPQHVQRHSNNARLQLGNATNWASNRTNQVRPYLI